MFLVQWGGRRVLALSRLYATRYLPRGAEHSAPGLEAHSSASDSFVFRVLEQRMVGGGWSVNTP